MEEENQDIVKQVIEVLKSKDVSISDAAIQEGLLEKIPGRFQKFGSKIFYDGAHNPDGIKKSLNTIFDLLPEDSENNVTIICGFTREANLSENIQIILDHEHKDRIDSIIFTESEPGDPEMINFQPICIKIERIKELLGDIDHTKLSVLAQPIENEFSVIELSSLTSESGVVSHLQDILGYVENEARYKDNYIFIFGTFKLYRDLYFYDQHKV